jgi:hypothetical protein
MKNMDLLKTDFVYYPFVVVILALALGIPVAQYYFFSSPWDGMNCDEMIDFSGTPEHQELTTDKHMEFHKAYTPCLEKD